MSDPLPTNPADAGPPSEADRDARIERLLLSGLDQYFAGQYERAINIWTRVSFLERGHGRARAYIERARGALAERQRESEELVHAGVEAYHAGELDAARELLTRATAQGTASDTALLFIDRLRRMDAALPPDSTPAERAPSAGLSSLPRPGAASWNWLTTVVASVLIAAAIVLGALLVLGALRIASWIGERPIGGPTLPAVADPLPVVRQSDLLLRRARALHADGQTRESLRLLATVDVGDPNRAQADRLTAAMQRSMLGLSDAAHPLVVEPAR
jgi:hypothetical protein